MFKVAESQMSSEIIFPHKCFDFTLHEKAYESLKEKKGKFAALTAFEFDGSLSIDT